MKFRIVLFGVLVLISLSVGIAIYQYVLAPTVPHSATSVTPVTPPASSTIKEKQKPTATDPSVGKQPNDRVATLDARIHRPSWPDQPLAPNTTADRIVVEKKARRLTLFFGNRPIKAYDIALGRQPDGPKRFQGDNKTPEGHYKIDARKQNSAYHRALHISYPSRQDAAFAAAQKRPTGGDIMIHGLPNGMGSMGRLHLLRDWTAGCIAVTNSEIEEIWRVVRDGTPIEIRP